jgi:hypothetical protein
MGPGVPVGEPVTGRLGALDDLPKVVVRSVTSGSACGIRESATDAPAAFGPDIAIDVVAMGDPQYENCEFSVFTV